MYDILIVGAGLYGATLAERLRSRGQRVLVLDRRRHIAGNAFTEEIEGIRVHRYGAHIFHTNNRAVWEYVNRFAEFNRFTNSPVANYHGEIYSLPFNMYTFNRIWGVRTPAEAQARLEEQRAEITGEPHNLEEQAIRLVGRDIYERLVKGYTQKQWGRPCDQLPPEIIRRLPLRLSYDNNYFNARFQGIPIGGYTRMVEEMLRDTEVRLDVDYLKARSNWDAQARRVVFTGPIDEFYGFCFGPLEYRTVSFETEVLDMPNFQGNAVVNYTDEETPWTRIIEHKWFDPVETDKTVVSREYSREWKPGDEPYYPLNDAKNAALYERYAALAKREKQVVFGGRLGSYRYYDMDQVIGEALKAAEQMA